MKSCLVMAIRDVDPEDPTEAVMVNLVAVLEVERQSMMEKQPIPPTVMGSS